MKPIIEKTISRILGNRDPEALLNFAPVQRALAELDAAQVAKRAALVEKLRTVPQRHEKACAAAAEVERDARKAVQKASDVLVAANTKHSEALRTLASVGGQHERELAALTKELEQSADARIDKFELACAALSNKVHCAPPNMVHNVDEYGKAWITFDARLGDAAMRALRTAIDRARALKTQALTVDEISSALARIAADLVVPLEAVNLTPPAPCDASGDAVTVH